jgi:hypothetical protein
MPVFCYDQTGSCQNLPEYICRKGGCLNDDECYFGGHCYHFEKLDSNTYNLDELNNRQVLNLQLQNMELGVREDFRLPLNLPQNGNISRAS